MNYSAVIKKYGNGYSAFIPDIPGCVSAAITKKETLKLLKEAIIIHLQESTVTNKKVSHSEIVQLEKKVNIIINPS